MTSPSPRIRLSTQNFPGMELINKFIAATPSYMYTPIAGQHTFYFSELLRSLSQAKKAELINISREAAIQQQLQTNRKLGRKRTWGHLRGAGDTAENSESVEPQITETPLELTSKNSAFIPRFSPKKSESPVSTSQGAPSTSKHPKINMLTDDEKRSSPDVQSTLSDAEATEPTSSSTNINNQNDGTIHSLPPTWYHPLYPPYGMDPANFFVDLRVSGHIFDRKRELAAQALKNVANFNNNNNIPSYFDNDYNKNRVGSAFTVPKSRETTKGNVMNLSSTDRRSPSSSTNIDGYIDDKDSFVKNTNYVMQNLPKIYNNLNENPDTIEKRHKKFIDNGITVYNIDDSDDNGCKKQEEDNSESDDDETIRVDVN